MNNKASSKSWLAMAGLITVTALAVVGMKACKPEPHKATPRQAPAVPIETLVVQRADFLVTIPSQGIVKARTESTLAAQVSGNIVKRAAQFAQGGHFKKGDWLIQIDDRDYQAALKLAEANLTQAQVTIEEEKARGAQAKRDWQRLNKNETASALVLRTPQLAAAKSQLASRQAQLDKARLDVERTRIIAPYNGRVLEQKTDVGDYVTTGRELGRIAETAVYEIALPISASWRNFLPDSTANADVTLSLKINGNTRQWHGQVVRTSANIDTNSRQLSLIVQVSTDSKNAQSDLLIGDYVQANIQGRTLHNVVELPRTALNDGQYVWVVEDNTIHKRNVTTVWQDDATVVISDGLNNGDKVNLTPLGPTISGTKVRLISSSKNETETISVNDNKQTQKDIQGAAQ